MSDYHRHTGGLVVPNNRQCWPEGCNRDSLVRYVVVLDAATNGPDLIMELIEAYRETFESENPSFDGRGIWQRVLTEYATPKPPRPAEPTGIGAVVEDDEGRRFVRFRPDGGPAKWALATTEPVEIAHVWSAIRAARVLSEGVSDE